MWAEGKVSGAWKGKRAVGWQQAWQIWTPSLFANWMSYRISLHVIAKGYQWWQSSAAEQYLRNRHQCQYRRHRAHTVSDSDVIQASWMFSYVGRDDIVTSSRQVGIEWNSRSSQQKAAFWHSDARVNKLCDYSSKELKGYKLLLTKENFVQHRDANGQGKPCNQTGSNFEHIHPPPITFAFLWWWLVDWCVP